MSTSTLHPGSFSSQHSMDQYETEQRQRDAQEEANRQEAAAKDAYYAAHIARAEQDIERTRKYPWMTLKTIDEHPDVATAITADKEGRAAFAAAQQALDAANEALVQWEAAAARGRRDDAALASARHAIAAADSNVRIAAQGVSLAADALVETRERIKADIYVNLMALQAEELRPMAKALTVASEHSIRAAAIEDASARLLRRPYVSRDRSIVRPLPPAAWRKDFHPKRGFFVHWLKVYARLWA